MKMMRNFGDNRGGRDNRGGNRSGGFGGNRGGFGGGNRPPREMHKAVCTECGQECEVPFKPTEGKPVRCSECFKKFRDERRY
jgi:DNA-directed RNA polymerase